MSWFKKDVKEKKVDPIIDLKKEIKEKDIQIKEMNKAIDDYKLTDRPKWNYCRAEKRKYGFFEKRALKKHPEITYFISMIFPNGTYKEFILLGERKMFSYGGRHFMIDTKETLYDLTQNQFRLIYHFNESMPVEKNVKPHVSEGGEAWLTVKSDNLRPLFQQEYVKNVASANEISLFFKINLILSGFNLFFTMVLGLIVFMLSRSLSHLVKAVS